MPRRVAGDLEVDHRRGGERLGEAGLVEAPERGERVVVDGEGAVLVAAAPAPQLDAGRRRRGHQLAEIVAQQVQAVDLAEPRVGERSAVGTVQRGGDDRPVALLAQPVDRVLDVGGGERAEVVDGRGEVCHPGVRLPRSGAQARSDADGRADAHCLRE